VYFLKDRPARRVIHSIVIGTLLFIAITLNRSTLAQADSAPPPPISAAAQSWNATTPTAHYRGESDWLVEIGQYTAADAYGPFPGRAYKVGDTEQFFALDYGSTSRYARRLTATLKAVTDHAYWWFEQGTTADMTALTAAETRFETGIYPLDHKLFGSEWNPGIDGDAHIFLLHQKRIGGQAVGVFSSKDECAVAICGDSNQHEMLYIGLDFGPVNSPQELTVISHELQHLIQFNNNGNEQRWLDEGLAQLAEQLNGFNPNYIAGDSIGLMLRNTNFQLNSWPPTPDIDPTLNYATSYMFCVYVYQRFGVSFIQAVAQSKYKGMAAFAHALTDLNIKETLDQVFTDWTVTNYVNIPYVGDGRYYYQSLKLPQRPTTISLSPDIAQSDAVHEYGAEYLTLSNGGTYTLTFKGQTTMPLLPVRPPSGQWMWWSYNEPRAATRLDRAFDLTNAANSTLTFKAWWDIQQDADLLHILVSTDDGQTWQTTPATHTINCSFGGDCYTGQSQGWQTEKVDLSAYDGQKIQIRFEYITRIGDAAAGMFLTDFHLDAVGFTDDVQHGDNGWLASGFMRITQTVPQNWALNVITRTTPPQVIPLTPDSKNSGVFTFIVPTVTGGNSGAIIVVDAMAPFVQGTANYTLTVHRQ
jgi:hypothetical protein